MKILLLYISLLFFNDIKYPTYKGDGDLISFIQSNLSYPEDAKDLQIEGKVFVQFVVNKSGETTKVKILKGDKLLADEAERVTKLITWNPGEVDGKIAKVEMVLPFTFKLPK